jgi:eukaryotic-like serine/threonine-protein kinase
LGCRRRNPEKHDQSVSAAENTDATRTISSGEAVAGIVIGPYYLLQSIGQGGMGEVWLAEQKEPVRRRVAIKLIKAGMDTREVVARFESERQALALMDHPAIAKVFDAGATPQGRPDFVMEYVNGVPITDYCDKHRMTPRERLELFIHVCEGVQHAHQKAIIHRDLKPSNILVCEVDRKPTPRIIDFGLAKATAYRLTAETMFTRVGALVGTPGYMSPEQADSTVLDVDTRTDVYSLGVVLYELLVGALPLDLRQVAFDEVLRRLREEDAPRPSTKLRALGERSGVAAQNRGVDPDTLQRQLRGDLDAITLKALEKDRARRYAASSELAADIGRYLRNEPVAARPASVGYQARKYVRRHRVGVSVASAGAVLLVAFAVAQTLQLQRTRRERDRADRITEFMTGMFKVSDPSAARGNSITAREILDKASTDVGTGLNKDPELQAQMMHIMGDVYEKLGLFPQAESLLTRAVDIRRHVLGPGNRDTLTSMSLLGWVIHQQGRYPEAEKLIRETLDIRRRVFGPEARGTIKSMQNLAAILANEGHFDEAEKVDREALLIERRALGPEDPATLGSMTDLANVLGNYEGHWAEAETLEREALDVQRRVLGPDDRGTLRAMMNPAAILDDEGHFAEAEKVERAALDIQRRIFGPEHRETLTGMVNLAGPLIHSGQYGNAEKLIRETLDIQRRVLGPEFPDTAMSTYNLAIVKLHTGKPDEALSLLHEAVDHGLSPALALGIEDDPDLKSLHGGPRFDALVMDAKERAAANKTETLERATFVAGLARRIDTAPIGRIPPE